MTGLRDDFAALVAPGARTDLGRAALHIARIGYPTLDVAHWLAALDDLAASVQPHLTAGMSLNDRVDVLAARLFGSAGFRGNADDYYDPRNSFLNDVLERRIGIPITLAVVLIETGARLALPIEGVGFPGHFLVRTPGPGGLVLRDPFFGGRVLDDDELLARFRAVVGPGATSVPPAAVVRADTPAILTRMLRNLLHVYVEREDHAHALAAVDLLLVLAPDSCDDLRTRGLLYERLECHAAARADLCRYLDLAPDAPDAAGVRERIVRLGRAGTTLH
jgi:regulator of sirC expression with transglutaminase-like and TPR domain